MDRRARSGAKIIRQFLHWPASGATLKTALVVASLFGFLLGLRLLVIAAGKVGSLLDDVDVSGPLGLLGFGWLGASAVLSGSPIAAVALTLLDGGAVSVREAVGMLAGSRFGASFIALAVAFVAYLRGYRGPDAVYVGVIALLTTTTIYIPSTLLAVWIVDDGWLGSIAGWVPSGWGSGVNSSFPM